MTIYYYFYVITIYYYVIAIIIIIIIIIIIHIQSTSFKSKHNVGKTLVNGKSVKVMKSMF